MNPLSGNVADQAANHLIARLPRQDRQRVLAHCEPVALAVDDILCEPDRPYTHAYFPLTASIRLMTPATGHLPIALDLVGNEGMLGATLALGSVTASMRGIVQLAGYALRMPVAQLQHDLHQHPMLQDLVNCYLRVMIGRLSLTATCHSFHHLELRLARWLLMTHDRAHADHFRVTHQLLAGMLGVRRSAVTIAAGALQHRQLISYARGKVWIVSRSGLEAAACTCYGEEKARFRHEFSSRQPGSTPGSDAAGLPRLLQ
jgi:hypothetical protein